MAKAIKVKDLINVPRHVFLYCPECGSEYSATHGDYFMANPETTMKCCRVNNILVERVTRLVEHDAR
jgi:hypothetical protein